MTDEMEELESLRASNHAFTLQVEELEDEGRRLRARLQEVEEDRNGALHREHEASEQMRFCHKILDRIGAPRNQDNGLSYNLNGRLSRLIRNETGKLWEAEMQTRERLLRAYVRDEDRYNRGEGEPFGSIDTETGMLARLITK